MANVGRHRCGNCVVSVGISGKGSSILGACGALCWCIVLTLGAGFHPARADTFAAGSLIIPMDTTYQDTGMLKAYGLVYQLLENGVPVRWVIQPGKAPGGTDFTASAVDHQTGAPITAHGYRGGPFVVDAADAATAIPFIDVWQTANPATSVHEATAAFIGTVAKTLVVAPKIAIFADGNQTLIRNVLIAAGIPDSAGNATWPDLVSPDLLSPAALAGPTTTNHSDGALFDQDGDPVYCHVLSGHWNVTEALLNPEVVAEARSFLGFPVHVHLQCQAVSAFENLTPHGFFLTPNGYVVKAQSASAALSHADWTFAQIDGVFGTTGGSHPAFALPAGDSYKAAGVTFITALGSAPGTNDIAMVGYLDGLCPPSSPSCGAIGKVSHLGGHMNTITTLPISSNPRTNAARLLLNSLFDAPCGTLEGQPQIAVSSSAPSATSSPTLTYALDVSNTGQTTALGAILTDDIPSGSGFVSATGGGTYAQGRVTWNLGNLGAGESASVQFTVSLSNDGSYENFATLSYASGLNHLDQVSNTSTTSFLRDTDGDSVPDASDCAPANANDWAIPSPARELRTNGASITTFIWDPPSAPGGVDPIYDVLRSTNPLAFFSAVCVRSNVSIREFTDLARPASGGAFFYVVRVENSCGSNMGSRSSGVPREGRECP